MVEITITGSAELHQKKENLDDNRMKYPHIGQKNIKVLYGGIFKSMLAETWRVILVSYADILQSESLRIHAERITQEGR